MSAVLSAPRASSVSVLASKATLPRQAPEPALATKGLILITPPTSVAGTETDETCNGARANSSMTSVRDLQVGQAQGACPTEVRDQRRDALARSPKAKRCG